MSGWRDARARSCARGADIAPPGDGRTPSRQGARCAGTQCGITTAGHSGAGRAVAASPVDRCRPIRRSLDSARCRMRDSRPRWPSLPPCSGRVAVRCNPFSRPPARRSPIHRRDRRLSVPAPARSGAARGRRHNVCSTWRADERTRDAAHSNTNRAGPRPTGAARSGGRRSWQWMI